MGVLAAECGWTFAGAGLGMANAVRHRVRGYRTPRPFGADDVRRNVDYVLGVVETSQRQGWTRPGGASSRSGRAPTSEQGWRSALGASTYVAVDRFPLHRNPESAAFVPALGARLGVDVTQLASRAT